MHTACVFFIDDEQDIRLANEQSLQLAGFDVCLFETAEAAIAELNRRNPVAVVCDIRLPRMDGHALLAEIHRCDAELPVVLITGHGDIAMAVRAMHDGAYDFIEKPFSADRLVETVRRAVDKRRLSLENRQLKQALQMRETLGPRLVGKTAVMQQLRDTIGKIADTDADVLVQGETGTGKELVARLLHENSPRREQHFVALNCGAVPSASMESELFGHEKGAFVGADATRVGKFEYAQGGTLFLDEIESMPLNVQVQLLRVLQERSVERIGSNEGIALNIRVVAASKIDLNEAVQAGRFRADLYYRLCVVTLPIVPLRQRREDIPLLFHHFCLVASARYSKPVPPLPSHLWQALMAQHWPGNVRELRNAAERFVLFADEAWLGLETATNAADSAPTLSLSEQVELFERTLIEQALAQCGGRINQVMSHLGVARKTLYDKIKKHGLNKNDFKE